MDLKMNELYNVDCMEGKKKNGQFVANEPIFNEIKYRLYDNDKNLTQVYTLQELISKTFRRAKFKYRGVSTGIKDKNGVEIYEGDIVKELWESINGVESTFHMRVFKDNTGAWRVRYPNYTLGNVIAIRKRIEVIGSVYENPELLEVD